MIYTLNELSGNSQFPPPMRNANPGWNQCSLDCEVRKPQSKGTAPVYIGPFTFHSDHLLTIPFPIVYSLCPIPPRVELSTHEAVTKTFEPSHRMDASSVSSWKGKASGFSLRISAPLILRPKTLPAHSLLLTTLQQFSLGTFSRGQALSVMEASEARLTSLSSLPPAHSFLTLWQPLFLIDQYYFSVWAHSKVLLSEMQF